MKPIILLIITLALFSSCEKSLIEHTNGKPPSIPWTDTSAKHPMNVQFKDLLEKYRSKGMPGISLLVNDKNGTWVGATGKADIIKNIPFEPGTVSKAASITKLMVGSLVFKLMEDSTNSGLGYRSLHLPITTWLPKKITDKLPNGNIITLGQCMKHETGIEDLNELDKFYLAVLNNPNKRWQAEELLEFVYGLDPLFAPSDTAIYSNSNTVLVAMIIEAATGKKHSDLLRSKILSPLEMNNTFYQPHDPTPSYTAQGYFDLYNNNTIVNVSNLITGSGNGFGGMFSNVFDLYTYIDRLLIKKDLLLPKSLQIMETYGKPDFPNEYGYGIMKKYIDRGIDAGIGHSGRDVGYSANMFYFPNKKVTHAFFINYGTDGDSKLKAVFQEFTKELLDMTLK